MWATGFEAWLDRDEAGVKILAAVRGGGYLAPACRAVGINPTALKYWRRRIKTRPRMVPKRIAEFIAELDQINATIEADLTARAQERKRGWRAAAWELERRFPTRWGRGSRRAECHLGET